MSTEVYD